MLLPLLILPLAPLFPFISSTHRLTLALWTSFLNFIHSILLLLLFDPHFHQQQFQFFTGGFTAGIDGLSLTLVWLVTLMLPIAFLSLSRVKMLSIVAFWSIAAFIVLDLLYFYISFEGVLIPIYFLIAFYGGVNRKIEAAFTMFLYTLFGSLLFFLSLLLIYSEIGDTSYHILLSNNFTFGRSKLLWLALFLSMAIKIPQIPFHLWLIEAHVEAPTAVSVWLAAILLKLGGYGFLRFSIPLFPEASLYFAPLLTLLALIAIIYASLAALAQIDLKKMIAYSSIAHMNFALLALFSNNFTGIIASFYFLISHGLISAALFLLVGFLYSRYSTRIIKYYKGVLLISPLFSLFLLIFSLANSALPLTSGFIAEFFLLLGIIVQNPFLTFIASLAIIITPAYSLMLYHRVSTGQLGRHLLSIASDLNLFEFHLLFWPFFS